MKATGKLISFRADYEFGGQKIGLGDTVTIELPRGMKVIGKCEQCKTWMPKREGSWMGSCSSGKMLSTAVTNKFGCIYWKPRKTK